jgi:spore coat polysaccharide biosynthesis predicted glycosyltransferase SpsG
LDAFKLTPDVISEKVIERIGEGEPPAISNAPFTPRSKKVLELGLREALQLGRSYIGTEHLLLGLSRSEGIAEKALAGLHVRPEDIRPKVLAIVDGDDRSIDADVYVDHNIGAEKLAWPDSVRPRLLAGSRYALIRQAVLDVRRNAPWELATDVPHVVAVMGGSDPTGMIVPVASALAGASTPLSATIVCAPAWRTQVDAIVAGHTGLHVVPPTNDLPALLGTADIAVSAAGTSSWELCTLGIPSVLVEVVDNQTEGLRAMTAQGLVIGISPRLMTSPELEVTLRESLDSLCTDAGKRRELSQRCLDEFDGRGAERVVTAMEQATSDAAPS